MKIDAEYVRSVLDYDPETGVFSWKKCDDLKNRAQYRKSGKVAGFINNYGYVQISIKNRSYMAHRLAWLFVYGEWPTEIVDHIDRDSLNNRISNLRLANHQQNRCNSSIRIDNRSGYTGVSWSDYDQKWRASIVANGQRYDLGLFSELKEAGEARFEAEIKHFGEFRPNKELQEPIVTEGRIRVFQDAYDFLSKDKEMTLQSIRVLLYIYGIMDVNNEINKTKAEIANGLGMKKPNVSRAFSLLVAKRILLEGKKFGNSRFYKLNPNFAWKGNTRNLNKARREHADFIYSD
jgi:hypothetical protein